MSQVREFSGNDVQVVFLNKPAAISAIKYKVSQEKINKKVLGRNGTYSRVVKSKEYEGEVTMPQSEFEALQRSLPTGKDPLDIAPFDILVIYVDTTTGFSVTDKLKGCEFTEFEKSIEVEGEGMDITCPLIISSIEYNLT